MAKLQVDGKARVELEEKEHVAHLSGLGQAQAQGPGLGELEEEEHVAHLS